MELFLSPAQVNVGGRGVLWRVYREFLSAHSSCLAARVEFALLCVSVCERMFFFCLLLSYFIFVISLLIRGGGN